MLPTVSKYKPQENGWMLLPKMYVYLGAIVVFLVGTLFGSSYRESYGFSTTNFMQANERPTVLVTGGLGFIGSHVVEDLIENGFHVSLL
jgi:hypothetical protein